MRIFSWRLILVMIAAVSLIGYPKAARAMTVDVTVGPSVEFGFFTFVCHDSFRRSGALDLGFERPQHNVRLPGACQTVSGILEFITRERPSLSTFNSAGRSRTTASPHGGCCGMVGTVIVVSETPTPTPTHLHATATSADGYANGHTSHCHANPHAHTYTCCSDGCGSRF